MLLTNNLISYYSRCEVCLLFHCKSSSTKRDTTNMWFSSLFVQKNNLFNTFLLQHSYFYNYLISPIVIRLYHNTEISLLIFLHINTANPLKQNYIVQISSINN